MAECARCDRIAEQGTLLCEGHRENCPECGGWRGSHGVTCSRSAAAKARGGATWDKPDRPVGVKVTLPCSHAAGSKVRVTALCVVCQTHGREHVMGTIETEPADGWLVANFEYTADVWTKHAHHAQSYTVEKIP